MAENIIVVEPINRIIKVSDTEAKIIAVQENQTKIISVGQQGPRGVKGPKGINFVGGFNGFNFNDGIYDEGFEYDGSFPGYNVDDAVYFLGSTYVCLVAGTKDSPIVAPEKWEILVQKGDPGTSGSYVHTQSTPSNNWIINHNLGYNPIVQVFNSGNMEIDCAIVHVTNNQVQIPLVSAISGYARLL